MKIIDPKQCKTIAEAMEVVEENPGKYSVIYVEYDSKKDKKTLKKLDFERKIKDHFYACWWIYVIIGCFLISHILGIQP